MTTIAQGLAPQRHFKSPAARLAQLPLRFLLRIHRDDAGNLGVLLLLTIWALVLLIAMVWNTGETATRRANIQNASDTSAHSLATWMVRVTNQESATNMAIGENASAEILLRSVQPTIDQIAARLTAEEKNLKHRIQGDIPQKGEPIPDIEYYENILGIAPWSPKSEGGTLAANLGQIMTNTVKIVDALNKQLTPAQIDDISKNTMAVGSDDGLAIVYIDYNWLGGRTDHIPPGFDLPPLINGRYGVDPALAPWVSDIHTRFDLVLNALPSQWAVWQQFIDQTSPAMDTDPASMPAKRNDIHQIQLKFADDLPQAAEEQRQKMATLYKAQVVIANPANGSGSAATQPNLNPPPSPNYSGASVQAPVIEANVAPPMEHTDSIRAKYPDETRKHFGTLDPTVMIDAINVNMDFAVLWHPGAPVQATVIPKGNSHTYHVASGEYGAIQCAPLARFVNDRVSRDEAGLANLLQGLDNIRSGVRTQVYPAPWVPNPIPPIKMVQTLTSPSGSRQISLTPRPLKALPNVAGAPADIAQLIADTNALIKDFNKEAPQYVNAVSQLYSNQPNKGLSQLEQFAINVGNELDGTTQNFAVQVWLNNVDIQRYNVLREMGYTKSFMVLKPYALRYIPEWARGNQQASAYQTVYNDVYNRSLGTTNSGWNIYQWNTYTTWTGVMGAVHKDMVDDMVASGASGTQAQAYANANAPGLARQITAAGSAIVAADVAAEWITRPWPYEITPPENSGDENSAGWLKYDRPQYFTLVVGATNTAENRPQFAVPKVMGNGPDIFATFAQSEAFNWMEYNPAYGGGDRYDVVSDYGHRVLSGSPAPWRLSTIGGWSWQPRLALSDQLPPAIEINPDLHTQFEAGGVPGIDPAALKALILH